MGVRCDISYSGLFTPSRATASPGRRGQDWPHKHRGENLMLYCSFSISTFSDLWALEIHQKSLRTAFGELLATPLGVVSQKLQPPLLITERERDRDLSVGSSSKIFFPPR